MSASAFVWRASGAPRFDDCTPLPVDARCWLCAAPCERGMARDDWMGASFVGQNRVKIPGSPWVCEPCCYVCSRLSPVPGRPPGKCSRCGGARIEPPPNKAIKPKWRKPGEPCAKCDGSGMNESGGNFRNYSHCADERGYVNFSKGEKPGLLAWLRGEKRGPWFAAIAESGQIHTLPHCPINPLATRRGTVLFEERSVILPPPKGWAIVDEMAALLTAGATKDEIGRGDYSARVWQLGEAKIREFEGTHGALRHGNWFELALYLAQRDEAAVEARQAAANATKAQRPQRARKAKDETRRSEPAGDEQRDGNHAAGNPADGIEERRKPAETVGSVVVADAGGGADHGARGRMGNEDPARSASRRAKQRSFAFALGVGDGDARAAKRMACARRA